MAERKTRIRGSQIQADTVQPSDLQSTNAAADTLIPAYDVSTGKFTWVAQGGHTQNTDVKIIQGDTKVEVVDTGTGYITLVADNVEEARINSNGLKLKSGADINEFSIDGTLAGNSDDAVPTEKAVKTYVDNLTGINNFTIERVNNKLKIVDRIENNIMLNAFRIAINGSLTKSNMVDGIIDEFEDETGVDTATSTNESYDSAGDYYSPSKFMDSYTQLLLHCDGTDGSTTFIDEVGHTVTAVGDAQVDTSEKVFGTGSALFDGTGDSLTIPDSVDWSFGAGDFTIDFRIRFNAQTEWQTIVFISSTNESFLIGYQSASAGIGTDYNNAGNYCQVNMACVNDQWYHVAIVRDGNTLRLFIDGIQKNTQNWTGITLNDPTGNLTIGKAFSGWNADFNGRIDEFRISKGIARWTSNFTPPGIAYVSTGETYNMTLISNSTEAEAQPDESRIVLFEEDVDAITLNTDLKVSASRDNGANWVQATLSDEGDYASSKRILVGTADISGQAADKTMKWKIETLNTKDLKIHGIGCLWG